MSTAIMASLHSLSTRLPDRNDAALCEIAAAHIGRLDGINRGTWADDRYCIRNIRARLLAHNRAKPKRVELSP